MNPSRHHAREIAFQILFQFDNTKPNLSDEERQAIFCEENLKEEIENYFKHFKVPPENKPLIESLVLGTLKNIKSIDEKIQKASHHWRLDRMSKVDLNLLRMATFELQNLDTPPSVTMNEAIEIAKTFGNEDSQSFINGLLDKLSQSKKKN